MANFVWKSLRGKLIFLALGFSIIPIIIVGYLSYWSGKMMIRHQFFDSLTTIAKSRENAIAFYLKSKTGRILDFSSDGFICDTLEKLNQEGFDGIKFSEDLARHLRENKKPLDPEIYGLHVLGLKGKIVASSEKGIFGNDMSDDDCFIEGMKGVHVKDIHHSPVDGKDFITISAPLISRTTKKTVGVIMNRYDLKGLNKITIVREGMGETGEVYVVNKDRYIVTESRFIKEAILKQKVDTVPVRLFQEHRKDMAGIYQDYRGIPIVGASAGGILDREFGLGWTILAEIDVSEAFAPVKVLAVRIIWIGFFVSLVVAAIAYLASTRIAKPIMDGVNVLGSSAREILAATTQVASGAAWMATAVSQTTTTVEEIKQDALVSVQKAKNVSEDAQRTLEISQSGRKSVDDSIDGMNRISRQMESIAESIVRLNEQSQAIGEIVTVVDDLAEQTNILSVNAAIEAAKAEEEGKGFTIVAQEIRNLAEQSKQSTAQVRSILNNIYKATGAAVVAAEEGSKVVASGIKQSAQARETIQLLSENIGKAAQAATQIVASCQQQMVGMDQVASAMENIKQASAENAASSKQVENATQSLRELGEKLKRMIELR